MGGSMPGVPMMVAVSAPPDAMGTTLATAAVLPPDGARASSGAGAPATSVHSLAASGLTSSSGLEMLAEATSVSDDPTAATKHAAANGAPAGEPLAAASARRVVAAAPMNGHPPLSSAWERHVDAGDFAAMLPGGLAAAMPGQAGSASHPAGGSTSMTNFTLSPSAFCSLLSSPDLHQLMSPQLSPGGSLGAGSSTNQSAQTQASLGPQAIFSQFKRRQGSTLQHNMAV